jgi:RNA polymerase sigma-70 factor, ECF subfamily
MIGALFRNDAAEKEQQRQRFEGLMRNSYRAAFGFALRLTGNPVEAEDLVQETYVRAFRFFGRYDASLPFNNWLYRIMSNAHIDTVRRKSRLKTTSLDQPLAATNAPMDIADESPSVERLLVDGSMSAEIMSALEQMTPEFRVAVLLSDVEGMAYEEIAEAMNTSVGTVRSRIHRGRKQLRTALVCQNPDLFTEGEHDEL